MPVSRFVALLAVLMLLTPAVLAQKPSIPKGSRDDLQGAKKIFVDTQGDTALRDLVVIQLLRQLPELTIEDKIEKDTLVVQFSSRTPLPSAAPNQRTAQVTADNGRSSLPRGGNPTASAVATETSMTSDNARRPGSGAQLGTVALEPASPEVANPRSIPSAFGRVLKRTENDSFVNVMDFWRTVRRTEDAELAAKDFVGKLAKEYRKANGKK